MIGSTCAIRCSTRSLTSSRNCRPSSAKPIHPPKPGLTGISIISTQRSRQFLAAHAFASVRRVLDIWESYLGHPIVWHFAETYERLEIIPWLDWDNAQSGYGYPGARPGARARWAGTTPMRSISTSIAHEVGHAILFSLLGMPEDGLAVERFRAVPRSGRRPDLAAVVPAFRQRNGPAAAALRRAICSS